MIDAPSIVLRIASAMLIAIACAAGMIGAARAEPRPELVDKLFEPWDHTDTPGMTVAILRDGKTVYARGFGMANVELSVPNGPDIVYPLASNSKQFTAFAIHLLAGDGKLSLVDDVRKHVPELPDFGETITLEMLIHHSSGLRDATSLLDLQGYGPEDAVSRQQALDLLWRQQDLNFRPGTEYRYNNSNYLLLGLVIERASGMSLAQFWERRIFQPLGMTATRASQDPIQIIPRRASGYGREKDRYTPRQTPDALLGASGISSTVGDLAIWLANFDDPEAVGDPALIAAMLRTGTLGDGTPITYASGLHREHYRGLPFIEHSGHNWGYKTEILRFPTQNLTIIILANADDSDPPSLAFKVADIYLKGEFPSSPPKPEAIAPPLHLIDRYTGTYAVATGTTLRAPGRRYIFRREDFVGPAAQLTAFSPTDFFSPQSDFRARFLPPPGGGPSQRVIIHNDDGDEFVARRVPEVVAPPPTDLSDASALAGDYWSPELGVLYRVSQRDGKLWLRYPRGEAELRAEARDIFLWRQEDYSIRFGRTGDKVTNFVLTQPNQRVRDLRFTRATITSIER
ncbi:serine hydrolase domain-containing protein [Sphingopyxis chilensis]